MLAALGGLSDATALEMAELIATYKLSTADALAHIRAVRVDAGLSDDPTQSLDESLHKVARRAELLLGTGEAVGMLRRLADEMEAALRDGAAAADELEGSAP